MLDKNQYFIKRFPQNCSDQFAQRRGSGEEGKCLYLNHSHLYNHVYAVLAAASSGNKRHKDVRSAEIMKRAKGGEQPRSPWEAGEITVDYRQELLPRTKLLGKCRDKWFASTTLTLPSNPGHNSRKITKKNLIFGCSILPVLAKPPIAIKAPPGF